MVCLLISEPTSDPLTLGLHTDKIFQSHVSSSSTALVLEEEFSILYRPPSGRAMYSSICYSWSQLSPCSCCFLSLWQTWLTLSVLVLQISWWSSSEMLRILFLVGKLADRQEDAFSLPANSPGSSLIYLLDLLSFRRFLIDSGAYVLARIVAKIYI